MEFTKRQKQEAWDYGYALGSQDGNKNINDQARANISTDAELNIIRRIAYWHGQYNVNIPDLSKRQINIEDQKEKTINSPDY